MNEVNKTKKLPIIILLAFIVMFLGANIYRRIDANRLKSKKTSISCIERIKDEKLNDNNVSFSFKKLNGVWQLLLLDSKKDDEITIINNSKIDEGKFYIGVLNSENEIIAFDKEKQDKITFVTPEEGCYLVRILAKNSSGKCDVKVDSKKGIDLNYNSINGHNMGLLEKNN